MLDDKSCVEVVERANHSNENEVLYLRRVYEKSEPHFESPCDSRLIGVHKTATRRTKMKVLTSQKLTKKAMVVDLGSGKKLFMVILHTNT